MRELLKKIIHLWPWPLTLNERYDRQTKAVLKKVCKADSLCIDVGCYRGDILKAMMTQAPQAHHIAFEPVPMQFAFLKDHFGNRATIYPYALGNENKTTTFHHVVSNPTYSGLRQRQYKGDEIINEIEVEVRKLDEVISPNLAPALIKIDVEGGEYDVMRGAFHTLRKFHPYLIFEHGIGGADKYGIQPGDVFDFLSTELGYSICLMGDFLKNEKTPAFKKAAFEEQFWKGKNCYFLAVYRK
jgi:FkbM family methyltransferase